MVCEVSFLFNYFLGYVSLYFFTLENRVYSIIIIFFLLVGGSVVNKAVITTNCNTKVGWRPFVQRPSLVYRLKSTRHGQWKAHSDCHAITEKSFYYFFYVLSCLLRLTPSTAFFLHILFSFTSSGWAVSWSNWPDNRPKLAQRPFEYSLSRQHWFIGRRLYSYLSLLLLQLLASLRKDLRKKAISYRA